MSLATAVPAATEPRQRADNGFRADLEGLRGVAVLLVVAFHADVAGFAGGFIGVDVFFVLSGWLITRQLLREAGSSGTIGLREFWARRVRRLVPALALVVLATLGAAAVISNPLELARTAREGATAITYTSNLEFASGANDYFAPESESLFLHTWSLAVEEQFYLVWPLGLLALAALTRRRPGLLRPAAGVAFLAVGAVSLVAAVILTGQGTSWAFFGLPTRAWEFAAAGLVAAGGALRWAQRRDLGVLGWLGAGAILWAAVAFDAATPYPSLPTLLPVAGTLALIMWGQGRLGPAAVLSTGSLRWLGRVSYSWYLWHWPVILLGVEWTGTDSTTVRCAGALVALGLAAATHRWLENPVRFSTRLKTTRWRTYALGGAATVVVLAGALALRTYSDRVLDDPLLQRVRVARDALDDTVPCEVAATPVGDSYCVYGDLSAARTVVLLGDSHARQWIPGLAAAADDVPVRFVDFARGGCPPLDLGLSESERQRLLGDHCVRHLAGLDRVLDAEQPDLVVLAVTDFFGRALRPDVERPDDETGRRLLVDGLDRLVEELRSRGTEVAFILDNPWLEEDPAVCVAATRSVERCTPAAPEALRSVAWLVEAQQRITAEADLPPPFDILPKICNATSCPLDDGEIFLWADDDHLSAAYTASQAPALAAWLAEAL